MERSASVPPNPFWSDRVQRDHELEEARPEDLPIQDEGSSEGEENKPQNHLPGVDLYRHASQPQQKRR